MVSTSGLGELVRRYRRGLVVGAAALAALNTVIYLLIGLGVVLPAEDPGLRTGLLMFGLLAGGAFGVGCVLLLAMPSRRVWLAGAAFQAFALVAYVQVAARRDPPFEAWGITLKVLQVAILVVLALLLVARADRSAAAPSIR